MDNDHNLIITPKGQYQYDADSDCYCRVSSDLTFWDSWGWIAVISVLTAIVYFTV